MSIARLFDFTPGDVIASADVDDEFNQLVELLNGTSTDKDVTFKLSHAANPPLTLDQTSSGPIQTWKKSGSEVASVRNTGQIRVASATGGSEFVILGGQIKQNLTIVGNVLTGEDDLHSHTLPANIFGTDGDSLEIVGVGLTAASGNNKTLNFYVDGQLIFTRTYDPAVALQWAMTINVIRLNSSELMTLVTMADNAVTSVVVANIQTSGHTFSNPIIVKWTGTDADGTTNRLQQIASVVRKFFAA